MAQLSLSCPTSSSSSLGGGQVDVKRRILIRTGGNFPSDTTLDVNNPGAGWNISGEDVTWSGANSFVNDTQVYRGGQHLLTGLSAGANNDVYFVAPSGNIAFEFNIRKNDVVQVWKFEATLSG